MSKFTIEKVYYAVNNNLALLLYEDGELYSDITVNLGVCLPDDMAYLNVNNMSSKTIKMLEDNKIFKRTRKKMQSGFVTYPLCKFNMKKIEEFNKGDE